MFTGISTVAAPKNLVANTGCVFPSTLWSCALPKELQSSVAPNAANQPNFRLQIQWDNSSAANTTFQNIIGHNRLSRRGFVGNAVSAGQLIRRLVLKSQETMTFVPSPAPPNLAEQFFLGNTTDNVVAAEKSGEATPFYVTFMTATSKVENTVNFVKRGNTSANQFPNITSFIPAPSLNSDGTAASANLLPLPVQQPIRLYDRGLPTEHYGFYNYFDRSIFLKSTALLDATNISNGEVPDDENGGSTESEALVRCTWAQTRFLVQMWTRRGGSAALLNSTGSTASNSTPLQNANNFARPGSFPYPVTITTDRHGGNFTSKLLYCYKLDTRQQIIPSSGQIHPENRAFGGLSINPAPSTFNNVSNPALGGFDGGSAGCSCSWSNFLSVIHT